MTARKKKGEKFSVEEYLKLRAQREKNRFRIHFYPWPVMLILAIPIVFFLLIVLSYFLYIRFAPNQ